MLDLSVSRHGSDKAGRWVAAIAAIAVVASACTGDEAATGGPASPTLPPSVDRLVTTADEAGPPTARGGWLESSCSTSPELLQIMDRGFYPGRSQDVVVIPREPNYIGRFDYTTHGGPWEYLQRVPLVFYGPGTFRARGPVPLEGVTLADVAPTLADLAGMPWPGDRAGRSLADDAVVPRARMPKVVLTVVLDGGGTDVLRTWPEAWPNLRALMDGGTYFPKAIVGSAPSVTPPVHATLGTGDFPERHGIVDLQHRVGTRVIDSYGNKIRDFDPRFLELSTFADLYDQFVDNESKVGMLGYRGWHLGMIGHGAGLEGGDRDTVAVIDRLDGDLVSSEEFYELPDYLHDIPGLQQEIAAADRSDGQVDGRWMEVVDLADPVVAQYSPAWTHHQTRIAEAMLRGGGFGADDVTDLFFVNYKQIDDVGHFYNMLGPQMREILIANDEALGDVTSFLDAEVGERRWAMVLTADHGETPDPRTTGAWPIDFAVLDGDLAAHFDLEASELILKARTAGYWFDTSTLDANGITLEEIADFLIDYRIRDAVGDDRVPQGFEDRLEERVLAAAFPGERLDDVLACARDGSTGDTD